jgi:hypothetical protein
MLRERLLQLDGAYEVTPSPYTMSIPAFKAVVDTHKVAKGAKILAYIYFMRDPRSIYMSYDDSQRHAEVSKVLFKEEGFKPDKVTKDALEEYTKTASSAALLLEAAIESISKIKTWLKNLDVESEEYDAVKHMRILGDMGKTINGLKDLEEAVQKESLVNDTYGGITVSKYNE